MKPPQPPRWASRLLALFCAPHLLEEVQGDLEERFQRRVGLFGERAARRQYAAEVLSFLRPFALKRQTGEFFNPLSIDSLMLRNYYKLALRTLWKSRMYTGINVLGLAVGIAACLLIAGYVANELSYDRFHANADRIYRVVHYANWEGGSLRLAPTSAPYAPALQRDYPEIEQTVRLVGEGGGPIRYGTTRLDVEDILFADRTVFEVFSHPFLYGDPNTALSKPQSIVLTRSLATRLFGDPAKALNQTILFENNFGNVVTGVIDDVPPTSHLTFSALRSLPEGYTDGWQNFSLYTYLLLREGTDPAKLQAKLPAFFEKYIKPQMGVVTYRMELQPLTSIHLHSNLDYEISPNGTLRNVAIFALIAGLILLIATINYMNLSTARLSTRLREVGVRKAVGSGRRQLVLLFLSETSLLTFTALLLGLGLTYATLPYFNEFSGKHLHFDQFGVANGLLGLLGFAVLVSGLSGSYPALFLSGFRPVAALKGQAGNQTTTLFFRKALVTFQFVITIVLIAASLVIYRQLRYVSTKRLGFNKEQVLTFHLNSDQAREKVPVLKEQLRQNPLIEAVASASNPIGVNALGAGGFYFEVDGKMSGSSNIVQNLTVDADYLETLEIGLAQGRNFGETPADRRNAILVNETLVRELGWKNPIGRRVKFHQGNQGELGERRVVGVVKDFHVYSLQHKIQPLALLMHPTPDEQDNVYVRIRAGAAAAVLPFLEKTYQRFEPGSAFNYHFLDQNFARQYAAEQKQGTLVLMFSALAILIACLGLFGLVTFAAEQRTKEIGVRKVLGASVASIVGLLSKDFLKLVLIAIALATPMAWYASNRWLQDFAYKIDIEWWVFALAGLLAVAIALLTVSFQSVKAALMNPVKSLRSE
jgi:putative ABC transport system permease protein